MRITHICKLIRHLIALDAFFYLQRTRLTTLHSPSSLLLAVTRTPPPSSSPPPPPPPSIIGRIVDVLTSGHGVEIHITRTGGVLFKVSTGDLAALWIPPPIFFLLASARVKKKQNCIVRGMNTHSRTRAQKRHLRLKKAPHFTPPTRNHPVGYSPDVVFTASKHPFASLPRRQLPATNTQIETHYLKSIAFERQVFISNKKKKI